MSRLCAHRQPAQVKTAFAAPHQYMCSGSPHDDRASILLLSACYQYMPFSLITLHTDLPCLLSLTSCQHILVHSLPDLKPLLHLSFPLLSDTRYINIEGQILAVWLDV